MYDGSGMISWAAWLASMTAATGLTGWIVVSPVTFLRSCKRLRILRTGSGGELPAGAFAFERGLMRMVHDGVPLRDLDADERRVTRMLLVSIQAAFALTWVLFAVLVGALAFA
jgi:hypothetical protein